MEQSLEIFDRLVRELLADEAENPVAEYIPSAELFDRLDLKLQKEGISAAELEASLKDLIFTTPRTCLLYTAPSPRDKRQTRMPSSA